MAGLVSCRIECVTKSALGADKAGEDELAEQVNERGGVNNLPTNCTSVVKAKLGNGVGACRLPFLGTHGSRRMVKGEGTGGGGGGGEEGTGKNKQTLR